MPDREKVIKGIRKCLSHKPCAENGCPYEDECAVEHLNDPLLRDALALIKEQEAEGKWIYGEDETGVDGWHCSSCGFFEPWFYEFTDDIDFIRFYGFCPSCGRKMISYTGKPTQEGR